MTGWRLGWTVLPAGAVRGFEKLAQHLYISAPTAAQHAAVAAFSTESISILEERRAAFAKRRDFLVPALKQAGLAIPVEPRGAFYLYADCGRDARRFTRELLEQEAVAAFSKESLEILEERRIEFSRRRDFLLPALKQAGLAIAVEPRGAFYLYADCGRDARLFTKELLETEAVAATPGVDFGANGTSRCVRFAYTRSMAALEEAARRIGRFVCAPCT